MSSHNTTTPAVDLYSSWLRARDEGPGESFDDFCARHRAHAAELRRIHADIENAAPSPLGKRPGSSAPPLQGPFAELLERLDRRRPSESRYREGRELGRGGMGQVLEAFDVDLRRSVAKKVMLGNGGSAPESEPAWLGRFVEEAQVTAQLSHPGIVPVHELGLDEAGRVYFTMDRVHGARLNHIFERTRRSDPEWPLSRVVGLLVRICETVAYAHSRNVLHRDLKPSNVMIGEFGEVYVMDWGLAKVLRAGRDTESAAGAHTQVENRPPVSTDRRDESDQRLVAGLLTEDGDVAGTKGYMAPEQAAGKVAQLDRRTDVYSLGALLYELLTGQRPYEADIGAGPAEYLDAIRSGPPPRVLELNDDAPPELASICERAIAWDPADRYDDAKELAVDLRNWLEGRVVRAHEQGAWAELRKWVLRNRALSTAIAVGVLAVAGGVTAYALRERQARIDQEHERLIGSIALTPASVVGLREQAESQLWPTSPARAGDLERWLAQAAEIEARLPDLREALAALRGEPSKFHKAELASVSEASLAPTIETLSKGMPLKEWITERLALAQSIEASTSTGPEAEAAWRTAIDDIATSKVYGGLKLTKQEGLLPLRKDPQSQLWEFWHAMSGSKPVLDPATGRWRIDESMGLVLVLIPGGRYTLGSPDVPEQHEDHDYLRERGDTIPTTYQARLDAYFLSKYEMTQAQWWHAARTRPSFGVFDSRAHPVQSVSWNDCVATLEHFDLSLPTEAQWEAAARAGASTMFYTGKLPSTLKGHVVLLPASTLSSAIDVDPKTKKQVLDVWGYKYRQQHEIVGGRLPNKFGLHDIHGNVHEWCLDVATNSTALREGDGLRTGDLHSKKRVLRGGGFQNTPLTARLAYRFVWEAQNYEPDTGLRPCRPVK